MRECPTCGGDGELATSHKFTCYSCKGSGQVPDEKYEKLLRAEQEMQKNLDASVRASEYRQMGG